MFCKIIFVLVIFAEKRAVEKHLKKAQLLAAAARIRQQAKDPPPTTEQSELVILVLLSRVRARISEKRRGESKGERRAQCSSSNPKVPGSTPGPVSCWGNGL